MKDFSDGVTGRFCWIDLAATDDAAAKRFTEESSVGRLAKRTPMEDPSPGSMRMARTWARCIS
jgi:hypothetical protein